jgi:hypothetical protein
MTLNYDVGITVEGAGGAVKRVAEVAGSAPAAVLAIAPRSQRARARSRGVVRNPGAGPGRERPGSKFGLDHELTKITVSGSGLMGDEELYFRK